MSFDYQKRLEDVEKRLRDLRIRWRSGSVAMKQVIEKNDVPPLLHQKRMLIRLIEKSKVGAGETENKA